MIYTLMAVRQSMTMIMAQLDYYPANSTHSEDTQAEHNAFTDMHASYV